MTLLFAGSPLHYMDNTWGW